MDPRMRHLPPLAAIRVFEAAARHVNFTTAAAELGMTQSAVSYQIRLLEERLGAPLFIREHGRVSLVVSANRAARLATAAFDMLDDAFVGLRSEEGSVLRISCAAAFATAWLAPRLQAFQQQHPAVSLILKAEDDYVDLDRSEIDVAVRVARTIEAPLRGERLLGISYMPMASPAFLAEHPIHSAAALLDVPRLSPDNSWWSRWFRDVGIDYRPDGSPGLRLDSQQAEANAAMAGAGVALLIPGMWKSEIADGRLRVAHPRSVDRGNSFWLVTVARRGKVEKIRVFKNWLLAEVQR